MAHSRYDINVMKQTAISDVNKRIIIFALLAIIITVGAWLRLNRLNDIPPGLWVDEAINGLQGHALATGHRLPDIPQIPYPNWPIWWLIEALSTKIFGCNVAGIRIPGAMIGIISIFIAYYTAMSICGRVGGLAAALFLTGSFWHINYSRLALPFISVVSETLLLGIILLRTKVLGVYEGIIVVAICMIALLGYAASLVVIPLMVFFMIIRSAVNTHPLRDRKFNLTIGLGFLLVLLVSWMIKPAGVQRAANIGMTDFPHLINQTFLCFSNWIINVSVTWGYWLNFPPGSPRFSRLEFILLAGGILAMLSSNMLFIWQKTGLLGWLLLAELPEIMPGGGIHMIRALPLLAPVALLVAIGTQWCYSRGKAFALVVLLLLVYNTVVSAKRLNGPFASSPEVASWYSRIDREAANYMRGLAIADPFVMSHIPSYEDAPLLRFHLIDLIDVGIIKQTDREMRRPKALKVFREPLVNQPILFLLEAENRIKGSRHLGLVNIDGLLINGKQLLREGRVKEAASHFEVILEWAPDSAAASGELGVAEAMQGKKDKAVRHLTYALKYSINNMQYKYWLDRSVSMK